MSKEQENLRQKFIDETKAELWAEDINEDVGFSDKYVKWLEQQLLIPLVVGRSEQLVCYKCETDFIHKIGVFRVCDNCGNRWVAK